MKTYYYLYKITNMLDGKIYVGVHKTTNLDDGYMGSGTRLNHAIKKYGIDNFEKTILEQYNTSTELYDGESTIVNEEFVKSKDTYNIKIGGNGGWDYINALGLGPEAFYTRYHSDENFRNERKEHLKNISKLSNKIGRLVISRKYPKSAFYGKHHSDETKRKIGKSNSKHQSGKGNSQYGTMWIYNLELKESKRIIVDSEIPLGWNKGRKMKFV